MYGGGIHAGSAHSLHNLAKTCLLMRASPLVRRLKYEDAITAAKHVIIPFELVAIAPRKRVRLEHDKQASPRKMLLHRRNCALRLVIGRSKAFEHLHAGTIGFSVEPAHNSAKARHRRCVLLDAGKAAGQHKRPDPNHVFDIVRTELGGLDTSDLKASLSQRELRDRAILDIFR